MVVPAIFFAGQFTIHKDIDHPNDALLTAMPTVAVKPVFAYCHPSQTQGNREYHVMNLTVSSMTIVDGSGLVVKEIHVWC